MIPAKEDERTCLPLDTPPWLDIPDWAVLQAMRARLATERDYIVQN
jgi:hypothetical protein